MVGYGQGEQRYSLRERVAHLESVVQELAKRLDLQSANPSSRVYPIRSEDDSGLMLLEY